MLLLILGAIAAAGADAKQEFSGVLNGPRNQIVDCGVVKRGDGDHLVIHFASKNAGNAVRIENDDSGLAYDYLFTTDNRTLRPVDETMRNKDSMNIPISGALGLMGNKQKPIFTRMGSYTIYVGYGFRTSDEPEIYGACRINYEAKASSQPPRAHTHLGKHAS